MRKRRKKNKKPHLTPYIIMLKSDLVETDKHSIKKLLN